MFVGGKYFPTKRNPHSNNTNNSQAELCYPLFFMEIKRKEEVGWKKKKEIACQVFRKSILCVFVFARRFEVRSTSPLDKTKQNGSCLDLLGVLFHD